VPAVVAEEVVGVVNGCKPAYFSWFFVFLYARLI
jgi:hypothetical protein